MAAAAISLIAGSSHLLQSLGLTPVTTYPVVRWTVHSKWAEWMASVPLLIFVLGHVSQLRDKFVFSAMAVQFVVIFLGYVADLNELFCIRVGCFIVAALLHSVVMFCIFVLCISFSKLRNFRSKKGNQILLNETMIKALGISTVLFWMVFPVIYIFELTDTISGRTAILSYPFLDVIAKGIFISILNAIHAEGEAKHGSNGQDVKCAQSTAGPVSPVRLS